MEDDDTLFGTESFLLQLYIGAPRSNHFLLGKTPLRVVGKASERHHWWPLKLRQVSHVSTFAMAQQPLERATPDMDDWDTGGSFDPLSDPEERRVIFAALDSFR